MNALTDPAVRLNQRSADLVALLTTVARTRMAGVPVLNAALWVEAVGFEPMPAQGDADIDEAAAGLGILITPWFMNLVRLPLQRDESAAAVGCVQAHRLGGQRFEFIGAHESAVGAFAACSLFSPMFEFTDQAAARDTARAVLAQLRSAPEPAAAARVPVSAVVTAKADATPARRSFLFGRSASAAARP